MSSPTWNKTRTLVVAVIAVLTAAALLLPTRTPDVPLAPIKPASGSALPVNLSAVKAERADGAIEGRVLDPAGHGVAGAIVAALRKRRPGEPPDQPRPHLSVAGSEGTFRIAGLDEATYAVGASARKLTGAFVRGIEVRAGETVRGIEVRLGEGGLLLSGRISDAGGGPIAGARVQLLARGVREEGLLQAESDGGGLYEIRLPAGNYLVMVDADGYAMGRETLDLVADHRQDFRLEPAARISGRVITGEAKSPVAGAQVRASPAERRFDLVVTPVVADEAGAFSFASLPPGSYRVTARKEDLVGATPSPVECRGRRERRRRGGGALARPHRHWRD